MIRSMLAMLKPDHRDVVALALRETDPAQAQQVAPIARGPVVSVAIIAGVTLLAACWAPFRLLRQAVRRTLR